MKKIKGFTLAEVLITLSILGVVAAILIPNTIQRISDRQTVTAVKKTYAMLDNALQQMVVVEGPLNTWTWPDSSGEKQALFAQKLAPYLNAGYCPGRSIPDSACWYRTNSDIQNSKYKNLANNYDTYVNLYGPKLKLRNGVIIEVITVYGCTGNNDYCWGNYGMFIVDINGAKKPNRYGYDVFYFPFGPQNGLVQRYRESTAFYNDCTMPSQRGRSCVPWIIRHNNLDYKYRDVSTEW